MSRAILTALVLLAAFSSSVRADYPEKIVRIVVGYPAGGPTDVVARLIAERLAQRNGQPFIVENKPGASSVIATGEVVRAKPDGYTLLMAASNHASNPAVLKTIPYDTLRALAGVALVAEGPHVLVVPARGPLTTVKAVVEAAKASPGKLTYSSSGTGGTVHFAGAMFEEAAGITLTHVPYKGAAPAIQDLLGGQIDLSLATLASVSSHVKAARLRMLAVAAPARVSGFPEVPTFAELGYPNMALAAWAGLLAPAGTPQPVIDKLAAQIREIIAGPEVQNRLDSLGMAPTEVVGRDFDALIEREIRLYDRIAKARNITAEQ